MPHRQVRPSHIDVHRQTMLRVRPSRNLISCSIATSSALAWCTTAISSVDKQNYEQPEYLKDIFFLAPELWLDIWWLEYVSWLCQSLSPVLITDELLSVVCLQISTFSSFPAELYASPIHCIRTQAQGKREILHGPSNPWCCTDIIFNF
jgi:hypothetical protein